MSAASALAARPSPASMRVPARRSYLSVSSSGRETLAVEMRWRCTAIEGSSSLCLQKLAAASWEQGRRIVAAEASMACWQDSSHGARDGLKKRVCLDQRVAARLRKSRIDTRVRTVIAVENGRLIYKDGKS